MRELAILTFLTLDGVMQAPAQADEDRSGGFADGGWATPFWDEVMAQVNEEAMAAPYDLLLGRKTYELFAPHFSEADEDRSASMMNKAKKYVATATLETLDWNNSTLITGDIAAEIAKLKSEDGPLLQVHGSWQLIQTLLAHDLIDEFRLWIFPRVVGSGKRLFEGEAMPVDLSLIKTRSSARGVVMTIYRRADKTPQ